jgi:phosphatidate cytidylyltransferase
MRELILAPLQWSLGPTFALMWGFLACATGVVYATFRQPLTSLAIELRDRIHTWWWIVAIVTGAFALGPSTSILLIAVLRFLAFRELHSVVPIRRSDRMILGFAYLAIPIQYYFIWTRWYGMFSIFVPVYAFTLLTAATVFTGETRGFIRSNATLHWALLLTVYNLSHLAYLAVLPLKHSSAAGGLGILLFVLVVVQFNDVAQFIWGRLFGRTRIVPSVSPRKDLGGIHRRRGDEHASRRGHRTASYAFQLNGRGLHRCPFSRLRLSRRCDIVSCETGSRVEGYRFELARARRYP